MAGDGHESKTVTHHHVLPLADDPKSSFLQGPYGAAVSDARNGWHS